MSSLSSAIGAQGFTAYACANAYLDALAVSRDRAGGTRWLAIGFDGWRFDNGEAVSTLAAVAMRLLPEHLYVRRCSTIERG